MHEERDNAIASGHGCYCTLTASLQLSKVKTLLLCNLQGKSMCFILPDLLFPGKVSMAIEPVVAIIINQVDAPDERD